MKIIFRAHQRIPPRQRIVGMNQPAEQADAVDQPEFNSSRVFSPPPAPASKHGQSADPVGAIATGIGDGEAVRARPPFEGPGAVRRRVPRLGKRRKQILQRRQIPQRGMERELPEERRILLLQPEVVTIQQGPLRRSPLVPPVEADISGLKLIHHGRQRLIQMPAVAWPQRRMILEDQVALIVSAGHQVLHRGKRDPHPIGRIVTQRQPFGPRTVSGPAEPHGRMRGPIPVDHGARKRSDLLVLVARGDQDARTTHSASAPFRRAM